MTRPRSEVLVDEILDYWVDTALNGKTLDPEHQQKLVLELAHVSHEEGMRDVQGRIKSALGMSSPSDFK